MFVEPGGKQMKRFLTELGATLIMVSALTVCHAQTMVGLLSTG
jgi:hypothetical protein